MNNITSWMQQAKEISKKISNVMYISAENNSEAETLIDDGDNDAVAENVYFGTETKEKVITNVKEVENKENILSNNEQTLKIESSYGDQGNVDGIGQSKLETNATATIEAAKKYANSFLSLAKEKATKAAQTAEETAKKLQNVVTEKTIIGNFDKEQTKFKDEVNANKLTECVLPWSDLPDQWIAKKHILSLSLDSRTFTRDPPSETNFDFQKMQSLAAALLKEDLNLRKIRFQLVPKRLSEERFWRNYFYRVSLVRQAALEVNCPSVAKASVFPRAEEHNQSLKLSDSKKENAEEGKIEINRCNKILETSAKEWNGADSEDGETENEKLHEIRKNIANATQERIEEDLERDLINSLNDYELVNDQTDKTDEQWEEEITELLNSA